MEEKIQWHAISPLPEIYEILRQKRLSILLTIMFCVIGFILIVSRKYIFTKKFLKSRFTLICIITFAVLLVYASIEPFLLRFSYNEISIPNKSFKPFTAVHLSDLHLQWPYPYVTEKSMMKVVEKVNKINPDFIFVTGDLVSRYRSYNISLKNANSISRILRSLKSKNGIYGVLGNNDLHAKQFVIDAWENANAKLLRQETIEVEGIKVSGIDPSKNFSIARQHLEQLGNIDGDCLKILLGHEPDTAELSYKNGFDLQLSGHTHGGQCTIPFGIGPIFLPRMGKLFAAGLYQVKSMLLYVTKGVGISPLPKPLVRFNTFPEVSVLHIIPK